MANHGWITSKKKMNKEVISQLINDLNNRLFKNNLSIELQNDLWLVSYFSEESPYTFATRNCWLEKPTKFVMEHSGGSVFAWWIDSVILNEVAVKFNGTICEDGTDSKTQGTPNKFDSFEDFFNSFYSHMRPEFRMYQMQTEQHCIPKYFHFQKLIDSSTVEFEVVDRKKRRI